MVVPLTKLAGGSFDLLQRDWLEGALHALKQPPPSPLAQQRQKESSVPGTFHTPV